MYCKKCGAQMDDDARFCAASLLALFAVAVVLALLGMLTDWLKGIVASTALYTFLLLAIGLAVIGRYAVMLHARKKGVGAVVAGMVLHFALSLIIMTLAYTVAAVSMAGDQLFAAESVPVDRIILMLALCAGLMFVLHLKGKYKEKDLLLMC